MTVSATMPEMPIRRIASSEWTAIALGAVLLALHAWWFALSQHQAEVLSGCGGAMTVLGVFVAGQPYIGKGLIETAREQVGLHPPGEAQRHLSDEQGEAETEGVRHVLKERVFGVALIGVGSLLNGYGPAIGSALGLRGS